MSYLLEMAKNKNQNKTQQKEKTPAAHCHGSRVLVLPDVNRNGSADIHGGAAFKTKANMPVNQTFISHTCQVIKCARSLTSALYTSIEGHLHC